MIRFTARDGKGNIIASTDYSRANTIELPLLGRKCYLSYELKAAHPGSFTYDYPQKLNYVKVPSPLKTFGKASVKIEQQDNTLTFSNLYNDVPVQYAWYIFKDGEKVVTIPYAVEEALLSYEFTESGNYKVQAYVQLLDESDRASAWVAEITVDQGGLKWSLT